MVSSQAELRKREMTHYRSRLHTLDCRPPCQNMARPNRTLRSVRHCSSPASRRQDKGLLKAFCHERTDPFSRFGRRNERLTFEENVVVERETSVSVRVVNAAVVAQFSLSADCGIFVTLWTNTFEQSLFIVHDARRHFFSKQNEPLTHSKENVHGEPIGTASTKEITERFA